MSTSTASRKFEGAALAERTSRDDVAAAVAVVRAEHQAVVAAYAGGLAAELASCKGLSEQLRAKARRIVIAGIGRRIDLVALLRKSRADRKPLWALADPTARVDIGNGGRDSDGDALIASRADRSGYRGRERVSIGAPIKGHANFTPSGMPALPARVRELATDPKVRGLAKWVGVLYQPEEWTAVNPDPALVVEWRDLPGQYYALAIWGGDRPELMEFVS